MVFSLRTKARPSWNDASGVEIPGHRFVQPFFRPTGTSQPVSPVVAVALQPASGPCS